MAGRGAVIFEFVQRGNYVKVSAIDVKTGTEVSIVGAPSASQAELERLAERKLRMVMDKAGDKAGKPGTPTEDKRGGRLV